MRGFIIESALLTHGLKSISSERLKQELDKKWKIAWLDHRQTIVGNVDEFCEFRERAADYGRVNYFNYDQAVRAGRSGALTASGAMRVCEDRKIPLVVTCGIGGLVPDQCAEKCNDLRALMQSKVSMLATSFKDMFDFLYSVEQAEKSGVRVCVSDETLPGGYVFLPEDGYHAILPEIDSCQPHALCLNPIPAEKRIQDRGILEEAVIYGKKQEKQGCYFHPAVNAKIDELTGGRSSEIQLESLIANAHFAEDI